MSFKSLNEGSYVVQNVVHGICCHDQKSTIFTWFCHLSAETAKLWCIWSGEISYMNCFEGALAFLTCIWKRTCVPFYWHGCIWYYISLKGMAPTDSVSQSFSIVKFPSNIVTSAQCKRLYLKQDVSSHVESKCTNNLSRIYCRIYLFEMSCLSA